MWGICNINFLAWIRKRISKKLFDAGPLQKILLSGELIGSWVYEELIHIAAWLQIKLHNFRKNHLFSIKLLNTLQPWSASIISFAKTWSPSSIV